MKCNKQLKYSNYVAYSHFHGTAVNNSGLILLILYWEYFKTEHCLQDSFFRLLVFAGFSVTGAFFLASATSDPTSAGFVVLSLVTLFLFSRYSEFENKKKIWFPIVITALTAMIVFTGYQRMISVYRDAPLLECSAVIEVGPAKGLYTTPLHKQQYNDCIETIKYIDSLPHSEEDAIFISKLAPWMYTCTNLHIGAPSPWRLALDDPMLEWYYQTHDLAKLKYVLVLDETYGEFLAANTPEGSSKTPNENVEEGFLYSYIHSDVYEEENVPCGKLYIRK